MLRWLVQPTAASGLMLIGLLLVTDASAQVLKMTDELVAKGEAGDPVAQYDLGLIYETGEGVQQNYQLAKQWYSRAAEQGVFKAQFEMGMLYAMGRFTQDFETAVRESNRWFDKLDEKRIVVDQKYYIGRDNIERKSRLTDGAINDMPQRIKWLHTVGEVGHLQTHLYLGELYSFGLPGGYVERNCLQAFYWIGKAAQRGHAASQMKKAELYVVCPEIPTDYAKTAVWYRKAALQGHVSSQIGLAGLYKTGKGVPRSPERYAYWIGQAAEQGNRVAEKALGDCYRDGFGVPQDQTIALSWYNLSAAQGYDRAQQELAILRKSRQGKPMPDLYEAAALFAFLWVALDAVSDGPDTPTPTSEHSSVVAEAVREAVAECRNDVNRTIYRCYTHGANCGPGGCTYDWNCQTGSTGRGQCRRYRGYSDNIEDVFCDPNNGLGFRTREEVMANSCR